MSEEGTFLDALIEAVRRSARYNAAEYSRPAAILWPDGAREWEPLLPVLRDRLPLLTLGSYDPATRTGPSHWVRCMLAGALEDRLPETEIPVLYMPGVSKQDLRAVDECPAELQPIASLQHEGVLYTQLNGKDWTVRAFIESVDGGLGVSVGGDSATRQAIQRTLRRLALVPLALMRTQAPLRAPFFDDLLNPDQARSVLAWLDDPDGYQKQCATEEWGAFQSVCQSKYGFVPAKDGPLRAAQKLGEHLDQAWELAWARFVEAPIRYPNIPDLLRRARPSKETPMFAHPESWPQDNEAAENTLRDRLLAVGDMMPDEARAAVLELDAYQSHSQRREWLWAKLGQAPLALALAPIARAAKETARTLTGSNAGDLARAYAEWGWKVDDAVLEAIALVELPADVKAVTAAVRSVYRPWLEDGARQFQALVGDGATGRYDVSALPDQEPGTCLLFVDGLRMDLAQRLTTRFTKRGVSTDVAWRFTALPTITATAKPAVSPVAPSLRGGPELSPATAAGSGVDVTVLRKLLREAEFHVLGPSDPLGDPNGRAWAEAGELDETGHVKGAGLARQLDPLLRDIELRVVELLTEGWKTVVVVTDHGFLLMPGDLPKVDLPIHLADIRKGRCARLKSTSITEQQSVPWHWDETVRFAMAPGIACFEAGKEYEHGGLSPQECVTPVITVTKGQAGSAPAVEAVGWIGLRCRVTVRGAPPGSSVDLRQEPANAQSSIVSGGKPLDDQGKAGLLVADDALEGKTVQLVVLSPTGTPLLQQETTVGGGG